MNACGAGNGNEQRAGRRECAEISRHHRNLPLFMTTSPYDVRRRPHPHPFCWALVARNMLCRLSHIGSSRQGECARVAAACYREESMGDQRVSFASRARGGVTWRDRDSAVSR